MSSFAQFQKAAEARANAMQRRFVFGAGAAPVKEAAVVPFPQEFVTAREMMNASSSSSSAAATAAAAAMNTFPPFAVPDAKTASRAKMNEKPKSEPKLGPTVVFRSSCTGGQPDPFPVKRTFTTRDGAKHVQGELVPCIEHVTQKGTIFRETPVVAIPVDATEIFGVTKTSHGRPVLGSTGVVALQTSSVAFAMLRHTIQRIWEVEARVLRKYGGLNDVPVLASPIAAYPLRDGDSDALERARTMTTTLFARLPSRRKAGVPPNKLVTRDDLEIDTNVPLYKPAKLDLFEKARTAEESYKARRDVLAWEGFANPRALGDVSDPARVAAAAPNYVSYEHARTIDLARNTFTPDKLRAGRVVIALCRWTRVTWEHSTDEASMLSAAQSDSTATQGTSELTALPDDDKDALSSSSSSAQQQQQQQQQQKPASVELQLVGFLIDPVLHFGCDKAPFVSSNKFNALSALRFHEARLSVALAGMAIKRWAGGSQALAQARARNQPPRYVINLMRSLSPFGLSRCVDPVRDPDAGVAAWQFLEWDDEHVPRPPVARLAGPEIVSAIGEDLTLVAQYLASPMIQKLLHGEPAPLSPAIEAAAALATSDAAEEEDDSELPPLASTPPPPPPSSSSQAPFKPGSRSFEITTSNMFDVADWMLKRTAPSTGIGAVAEALGAAATAVAAAAAPPKVVSATASDVKGKKPLVVSNATAEKLKAAKATVQATEAELFEKPPVLAKAGAKEKDASTKAGAKTTAMPRKRKTAVSEFVQDQAAEVRRNGSAESDEEGIDEAPVVKPKKPRKPRTVSDDSTAPKVKKPRAPSKKKLDAPAVTKKNEIPEPIAAVDDSDEAMEEEEEDGDEEDETLDGFVVPDDEFEDEEPFEDPAVRGGAGGSGDARLMRGMGAAAVVEDDDFGELVFDD